LSNIPEDLFSGLTKLHRINLSNNNLSSVPESLFSGFANLRVIDLHGNDLFCNPAVQSVVTLYVDNNDLLSCELLYSSMHGT